MKVTHVISIALALAKRERDREREEEGEGEERERVSKGRKQRGETAGSLCRLLNFDNR